MKTSHLIDDVIYEAEKSVNIVPNYVRMETDKCALRETCPNEFIYRARFPCPIATNFPHSKLQHTGPRWQNPTVSTHLKQKKIVKVVLSAINQPQDKLS